MVSLGILHPLAPWGYYAMPGEPLSMSLECLSLALGANVRESSAAFIPRAM